MKSRDPDTVGSSTPPDAGGGGDQAQTPAAEPAPREIGGRDGPDPTRYGDWEKAGRCIDF